MNSHTRELRAKARRLHHAHRMFNARNREYPTVDDSLAADGFVQLGDGSWRPPTMGTRPTTDDAEIAQSMGYKIHD